MTAMYTRLLHPPKGSFFLLGPRGTGKTTWVHKQFPGAKVFDLLDQGLYQSYLADVSTFSRELNSVKPGTWVVIDEIQRLPDLLHEVHRWIESKKLKFVLTGSSARKLKKLGTNLLAGRALHCSMHPFLPEEMGKDFNLDTALQIGTIPIIVSSDSPQETLEAYVQLYLKEEIQAEALVRNLSGFARFLPISALFHGQVMNISTLARDAGVARTTVNGYLSILEDTLVGVRLPAYESSLRVREKCHPKFYWFDPGVVRALKKARGPVAQDESGSLLEGFVLGMLRAIKSYTNAFDDIFYWSPAEAKLTEVDFLLTRGTEKIAIEVKSSLRIREEHFRGLRAIEGLKGLKKRILVYPGTRRQKTSDGIEIIPISELGQDLL